MLVKEGSREMRIDEERERMTRDEVDWVVDVAGEGGGGHGKGLSMFLYGVVGVDCIFQCDISCTRKRRARSRSRSSLTSSSAKV